MKNMFSPAVLLLALSVPALAQNNGQNNNKGRHYGQNNNDHGGNKPRSQGAPGPIVGASLPLFLIGGGIYWLVRRRDRAKLD